MKQGPSTFQSVADSTHVAQQMQGYREGLASTSASMGVQGLLPGQLPHSTVSPPLGAHMQEQFQQHFQLLSKTSAESSFIEPLLSLVGQECTQVLLLKTRVAFTGLVEKFMDEGSLFGLESIIKNARSLVISKLLQPLPKDVTATLGALQTVLQENQHTAAELAASTDAVGLWEGEMRFYAKHGGSFECRCVGHRVMVSRETMDAAQDMVLVTTDLTKEVRRAFFHAFVGGADVLLLDGPAGTGKTETCRDICHMLGRNPRVVSGSDPANASTDWLKELAQPGNVVIIDEANRMPRSVLEDAVRIFRDANIPLCFTHNSQRPEGCLKDFLGGFCSYVPMRAPEMPRVLSAMFASEGFQEADNLGDRLNGLFDYFRSHCTKQPYYDWGLRKMKTVTREAGRAARSAHFSDERQMVTAAIQSSLASSMAPIDQSVFVQGILGHFGADAFVPMPIPTDFWNAAATKISRTVTTRHASLCLPVLESEETFVMAVIEEEAAKHGADISCMPGKMAELSQLDMIGGFVNPGEWKDGSFTKALRDLVSRERPGWLVVVCGNDKVAQEKWSHLNSLMDDNKFLSLENGEKIKLKPDDRIIFLAQGDEVQTASPATISRLGVVNMDAHHRNRL